MINLVVSILQDHVRTLVEDINGNHAIQKVLFTFRSPNNQFIFDQMAQQCKEIACHKHGCCVMQKCIQGADEGQKSALIDEIIKNTQTFVRNQYGNYVVQYVLDLKDFDVNTRVGQELLGSLIELCNEKYSSNVIEKCLEHNHKEIKNQMVKEMLTADSYLNFLTDQYGNYVIQKTLGVAEKDDLDMLICKIKPEMELLKKESEFGCKIYNKLVKTYPSLQSKSAKTNKNSKKSISKGSKGGKRKGPGDMPDALEFMHGGMEATSYMQAAENPSMMGFQQPPPPPSYGQGFQGYGQDFSCHNVPNANYSYTQMSNAHFLYHNEGGNMGQAAPEPGQKKRGF